VLLLRDSFAVQNYFHFFWLSWVAHLPCRWSCRPLLSTGSMSLLSMRNHCDKDTLWIVLGFECGSKWERKKGKYGRTHSGLHIITSASPPVRHSVRLDVHTHHRMVWSVDASHSPMHHATVSYCYSTRCNLVILGILGYGVSCIILESCQMSGTRCWFRVLQICCSVVIVWYCRFVILKIRLLMESVRRELSLFAYLWISRNSFIVSFASANPGYEVPLLSWIIALWLKTAMVNIPSGLGIG
jgi:hypothetical protein